jgi:hypothetical protein
MKEDTNHWTTKNQLTGIKLSLDYYTNFE